MRPALLCVVVVCALAASGCGGSSGTPKRDARPQEKADSTKVTGARWSSLSVGFQQALAADCIARGGARLAGVDRKALWQSVGGYYTVSSNDNVTVLDACLTSKPESKLTVDIDNPVGDETSGDDLVYAKTRDARPTFSGTVSPASARVRVSEQIAPGEFAAPKTLRVRGDGGFTYRPYLRKRGENYFKFVAHGKGVKTSSVVVTADLQRPLAEQRAIRARRKAEAEQRRAQKLAAATQGFSGNGAKNLGTIRVSGDSILKWTNDGDIFIVADAGYGIFVNSSAHSGDTVVDAGTYRRVEVNAIGNWTIAIVPRG